jgi:hypothetical protein
MSKQPMQPIEIAADGCIRFRANKLVRFLLDEATEGRKCDMKLPGGELDGPGRGPEPMNLN